jgi:galactokinase
MRGADLQQGRLAEALARHASAFESLFGEGGRPRLFFAPGRVNLMGAHLDYNGGPVIPTAIDRGTFVALRARSDRAVRFASTLGGEAFELDLRALPRAKSGRWFDYPVGVLIEMLALHRARGSDASGLGLDVLYGGNLPVGAGLSSSASICVGTALALDHHWHLGSTPEERVEVALRAERGWVGVQCGIMDPNAVGLAREGQLLWLDCKDASRAYLPLDASRYAIAVADTLVRRELAQSAFNERVGQCRAAYEALRPHVPGASCLRDVPLEVFEERRAGLDPLIARRAEHVLHETARTFAARAALLRDDPRGFGAEMVRAHHSLRDLFEVSVPELDHLVESALDCEGVLGSRLTGAGFGGCTVILLERGAESELRGRLAESFERRFGHPPVVELYGGDSGPREVAL